MLGDFAKADRDWLEDLLQGVADGAPALAAGDTGRFQNAVALRTAPPRSSNAKAETPPAPKPAPAPEVEEEPKSKLQLLMEKFGRR